MKTAKITLVLIMVLFMGSKSFSQMPKPAESKLLDQLTGTWTGIVETPMGKSNSEAVCEWGLNHQFFIVKVKGTGIEDPNNKYEAIEFYRVGENGKISFWSFNVFGELTTGSGTATDNKYEYTSSSALSKETGVMNIDGMNMGFKTQGTYTMNGQEMKFDMNASFKKK